MNVNNNGINIYQNINIKNNEKDINKSESKLNTWNKDDLSKIEKIKSEIKNGTYKINLNLLSKKIADDLL